MRLPPIRTSIRRATAAAIAAIALAGCARVPTQSASMAASPEVAVSASQLQLQSYEMGRNLSTIIEQAADSIQAATTDPAVQRNALLLKISAIPLIQEAALRNDPHIASVDLLAFTIQLSDYLTTGSGRTSFGDQQPIAVAAAAEAEQAANGPGRGESPEWPDSRRHRRPASGSGRPITRCTDRSFGGASVLDSDWEALGFSDQSLAATVGNVDRTLVNISYRLGYLNETLVAEARWNGELAAEDAMRSPRLDSLFTTSGSALRSVGLFVDSAPDLIDSQRIALMRDIDLQRIALMRDVDRQRILAFQDLAVQREALQTALGAERAAAFVSADSLIQRSIDHSTAMLRRLVIELVVGTIIVMVALLGGGLLLINRWRATAA